MAATHDVRMDQGSSWSLQVAWKDSDGVAVDITDHEARACVREYPNAPGDPIIELVLGDGIELVGPATDGTVLLHVTDDQSAALDVSPGDAEWAWDLAFKPAGGEWERVLQGKWTVDAQVGREAA